MKYILAIAATLVSTTAFAGGYAPPAVEQPVVVPTPPAEAETGSDWTGGYVGLQYGQGDLGAESAPRKLPNGQVGPSTSGSVDVDAYGVHGGYLHDFGQIVAGGELDFNKVKPDELGGDADMWRLRGRAGYDAGRFLPYVTLGAARLSAGDVSETGVSYGVGADFKVTEKFTVGTEYTRQSFKDVNNVDGDNLDADLIQIRGAYHF